MVGQAQEKADRKTTEKIRDKIVGSVTSAELPEVSPEQPTPPPPKSPELRKQWIRRSKVERRQINTKRNESPRGPPPRRCELPGVM